MSDTANLAVPTVTRTIVVSLEDRRLALLEDGVVKKVYPVAVGKDATPSPTGTFTIVARVTDPTYYHDGKVIPAGPENPVGTRWMGLSQKGYGIHGTNAPRSIGKAASHGCIRMGRRDLEDLFAQVRAGDVVEIVGQRDAETAAIFGMPAGPATPAVTTVLAKAEPRAPDATAAAETTPAPADR
ncbi:MAG: L,D-transpeptidase [Acidobacteriaceae bacterium]